MFGGFEEKEEYEDQLYREAEDSSGSDADSEVEFQLYSQLHYSTGPPPEEDEEEEQAPLQVNKQPPKDVIVIDSGTEVITVSDNTEEEEEEGVCASKGRKPKPPPSASRGWSSTLASPQPAPALQSEDSVVCLDSNSDSVSDSDSDSDSDGVENWMILGQEKQALDESIQLNVEGGVSISSADEDEDHDENWRISQKDKESQICNKGPGPRRTSNRYYTNKTVTCRSCNKTGHLSKNCPTPRKLPSCSLCGSQSHLQKTCPNRHCSNCSLPGHCYDDCLERAYWHKQCHRCGMTGHFHDACPEIWRQYHLTTKNGPILKPEGEVTHRTPAYCYNCSRQGHFGFECNQRRMFNGTYPTIPYISHYDTPQEIRRRENRARKKAQELREAGLLHMTESEKTVRPQGGDREAEPPRKRAKHSKGREKKRKDGRTPAKGSKVAGVQEPQDKARTLKEKRKDWKELKKQRREAKAKQRVGGQRAAWGAEEEDFPRGPKIRAPGAPTPPQKGKPSPVLFSSGKKKRRRARGRDRKPENRKLEGMYPSDENLFIIKQRRKR